MMINKVSAKDQFLWFELKHFGKSANEELIPIKLEFIFEGIY